jgi:GNAT superfamily N-acetyltransferase
MRAAPRSDALADGFAQALLIRELVPGDRQVLGFLLRHLDDKSRYFRFHGVNPDIRTEIARLLGADHWHHEALIALSQGPRTPIGVVEYVRLDQFDLAEMAIAVSDDWQRLGVGSALLDAMRSRAIAAGVRRLTASVLADNLGALKLARKLGQPTALTANYGVIELLFQL